MAENEGRRFEVIAEPELADVDPRRALNLLEQSAQHAVASGSHKLDAALLRTVLERAPRRQN